MTPRIEDLENWVPIRVYWRDGGLFLDWCYMGEERFTQSFFDVSITSRLTNPFSVLFRHQTPVELLGDMAGKAACLAPTGFIFHMSRCGSTLVSQMFARLEQNVVISEALPIDTVLRANIMGPAVSDEQRATWLRWLIGAFARKRTGAERGFYVKFDSWSTLDMEIIEKAFPGVPWVFLYRNPVEVMVSQLSRPGVQMIRGAIDRLLPGLPFLEALQMPAEEYCARVLGRFCEIALRHSENKNALLVNYSQLPDAVTGEISDHFGISHSPEDIELMRSAAKFDAKTPALNFTPDSDSKRNAASEAMLRAANTWVEPLYDQLVAKQIQMASDR